MKNHKLLIYLLIFLFLMNSCSTSPPSSENENSSLMTEEKNAVYLIENGKMLFDIVYPKSSKFANISVWVDQIETSLRMIPETNIRVYDDSDPPKSNYLILVGDTKYEESISESKRYGKGGFSICKKGNYIIINAYDELSLTKAVNWFCNILLKKACVSEDEKNVTLIFEENRNTGDPFQGELLINGITIEKYTIVYPANDDRCEKAAQALATTCNNWLNVSLQLVNDSSPVTNHEILIGKTNRVESDEHYQSSNISPMEYEYSVINQKLSVIAYQYDGYGLFEACGHFADNLMLDKKINLEDGFMKSYEVKLSSDSFASISKDADVRVMTANLLSEEWGGTMCMPRAEIFYANLAYYNPDVIGTQEVSKNWSEALNEVLKNSDYSILHKVVDGTDSNYCPLIYNNKRLVVVESGAYRLSIGGPARARTVTWAVFTHISTKKQFIVLNTHLDWIANANDYETTAATSHYSREKQVRELAGTFAALQEKYPTADILMTADWNTLKNKHPLNILCELTDTVFAQDMISNNDWGNEVDHILMPPDTKLKAIHCYYENGQMLGATDHPWGFVDIQLK